MQGPGQRCLLRRRRRASRPGFRPPPPQPPPGLPEPRPPQPHLRRLETRALGGAEEGGGRAEPGSTAASWPLSGAKPERERKEGGPGRKGGEQEPEASAQAPSGRAAGGRRGKSSRAGSGGRALGGVARSPTQPRATRGSVPPRQGATSPGFVC